jgi:4-hydroxy-tetrahydrodipicolinate reductase
MNPIPIMLNGLPGNVAAIIAGHLISDNRFHMIPFSLTGPEITASSQKIGATDITLVRPEARDKIIAELKATQGPFITIDYTVPAAVNDNARFYCDNGLSFVMGTTGGDRDLLAETVLSSAVSAVIAPNMAKQIVGFQAMMAYAAEQFPGLFSGYCLEIVESHQQGKIDTSGTAKAMVGYFNKLGISFSEDRIKKIRDPETQKQRLGVPEAYLGGHGWHTYTLESADKTATFSFTHNINGRDIYADGTADAVVFLAKKITQGQTGKVYSMIDVLKGV